MKSYTKNDFCSAELAKMGVGESIYITCQDERDVQNVRSIAAQYRRLKRPHGIGRYGSKVCKTESGMLLLKLTAMPG